MRAILLLVSVFFTSFLIAEPKQLVCTDGLDGAKRLAERCASDPNGYKCKQAPWGTKYVFIFDTDDLDNSWTTIVETQMFSCFWRETNPHKVQMSSTSLFITFDNYFKVDRRTLTAERSGDSYQCKLEDVDIPERLI